MQIFIGSATKILMLIPEYYDKWADWMEDYLNGIDENMWKSIKEVNYRKDLVENVGSVGTDANMVSQANTRKACDLRELRGSLPPFVYSYVRGRTTAKEIRDTLKDKY
ncbi:unnamed protein product [Lactuca saligna]|uniref:Uncharacterized protein n=1 Tax=Lactuca saligna TaxID=75948 RepID=A0AA35YYW3_LACSI|nr:unnamed protein product [Lactuca saligna]